MEEDLQTVSGLGEKLFLESNTLTPILKKLEAMGHLERTRDAADERLVRVRLTKGGRHLREKASVDLRGACDLTASQFSKLQKEIVTLEVVVAEIDELAAWLGGQLVRREIATRSLEEEDDPVLEECLLRAEAARSPAPEPVPAHFGSPAGEPFDRPLGMFARRPRDRLSNAQPITHRRHLAEGHAGLHHPERTRVHAQ